MPQIDAIRFRKYKSFGEEYSTIPLKRMTVLIGRNNSGKSSCIDVIEALSKCQLYSNIGVNVQVSIRYDRKDLMQFHISTQSLRHGQIGINFLFTVVVAHSNSSTHLFLDPTPETQSWFGRFGYQNGLVFEGLQNILSRITFIRLNAERDILPEHDNHSDNLTAEGSGATSLINHILNHEEHNEQVVQHDLLNALNEIMKPDASFFRHHCPKRKK